MSGLLCNTVVQNDVCTGNKEAQFNYITSSEAVQHTYQTTKDQLLSYV